MHLGLKQGEECGRGDKFFFLSQSKNQKEVWFTVSGHPPPPPVALGWGRGALVVLPGYPSPLLAVADFLP